MIDKFTEEESAKLESVGFKLFPKFSFYERMNSNISESVHKYNGKFYYSLYNFNTQKLDFADEEYTSLDEFLEECSHQMNYI